MKKIILAALFMGIFMSNLLAQLYSHDFQKSFGLPGTDPVINYTLEKTNDGGYIIAGMQEADPLIGNDQNKIIVYKTDANYAILWEFKYEINLIGLGGNFKANHIIERSNGGHAIAGSLIVEGQESGGFLMQLSDEHDLDWVQVYPDNPSTANAVPIKSIQKVAEKQEGYILIGSKWRHFDVDGIVMGVDEYGDIVWSQHVYDDQYTNSTTGLVNSNSVLTGIIQTAEDEFSIVGIANSFTIDDADILVVKIDGNGDISKKWIYECAGKEWNDGLPAYLDFGLAIAHNEADNALVIAGMSMVKTEGTCTHADSKDMLTLKIDLVTGSIIWSRKHNINVSLTFINHFNVSDIIYNADIDEYAICGTADNDLFNVPKTVDKNGFILRLNASGLATDIRYYGTNEHDLLFNIETGTSPGGYTMAGITQKFGKHHAWIVESFANIQSTCNQADIIPITYDYSMQKDDAREAAVIVQNYLISCIRQSVITENKVICAKSGVSIDPGPGDLTMKSTHAGADSPNSKVYPTIVTDILTIDNKGNHTNATIYAITGQVMMSNIDISSGKNNINIERMLSSGSYQLVLNSKNGVRETFRIIIE